MSTPAVLTLAPHQRLPELQTRISAYLEAGNFDAAYPLLCRLCELIPESRQAHLLAGIAAAKTGRLAEAIRRFECILSASPGHAEARFNLAQTHAMAGHYDPAIAHLRMLVRTSEGDADIWHALGSAFRHAGTPARALAAWRHALKLNPNHREARNDAIALCFDSMRLTTARRLLQTNAAHPHLDTASRAEIDRWLTHVDSAHKPTDTVRVTAPKPQVVVIAAHRTFIDPILNRLRNQFDFRVIERASPSELRDSLVSADLAWFEWCDEQLQAATRLPRTCRVVARLHSYEAFTDLPSQIDWSKVDHLVFVNRSVQELVRPRLPRQLPQSVIHNGLDLDTFVLPAEKSRSKRIASVGYINYKKNPGLLLYCFARIHARDPEFTLHIAGTHQDPRLALYIENYLKRHPLPVHFDGWQTDMPAWYADKGYVISTSLFESFHYSIAEGMACGLLPLIHDWFGADYLYPREFLFSDPESCADLVAHLETRPYRELTCANREWVTARYNLADRADDIRRLIESVLLQPKPGKRSW